MNAKHRGEKKRLFPLQSFVIFFDVFIFLSISTCRGISLFGLVAQQMGNGTEMIARKRVRRKKENTKDKPTHKKLKVLFWLVAYQVRSPSLFFIAKKGKDETVRTRWRELESKEACFVVAMNIL